MRIGIQMIDVDPRVHTRMAKMQQYCANVRTNAIGIHNTVMYMRGGARTPSERECMLILCAHLTSEDTVKKVTHYTR